MILKFWHKLLIPQPLFWGPGNAGNCERIRGYNHAVRYFDETKKPRGKKWGDEERPLYNSAAHHYRIVREDEEYFDLVLYSTPMIRYLKPDADSYTVLLHGDTRSTSTAFLWNQGWATWAGRGIDPYCAPLNPYQQRDWEAENGVLVPEGWAAVLVFDEKGKLQLDRSAHRPVYRRVSNEEDGVRRAQFKASLDVYIDMMVLRVPEFHRLGETSWERGRPYKGGRQTDAGIHCSNVRAAANPGWEPPIGFGAALVGFAQEVYNTALSKAVMRDVGIHQHTSSPAVEWTPLGAAAYRLALTNALLDIAGLGAGSARKPLPQFADLPRNYLYS